MSELDSPMYLSEHEAAPKQTLGQDDSEYKPSDEDKETIKFVNKLYSKAKKARKRFDNKWVDFYNFFRGRQWKEQRPSYRHSAVFNSIFRHIQSNVPIMTDASPKFDFLPEEPSDQELADILSEVADADFRRENWLYTITEMLFSGHFYGTGILDVGFDPHGLGGLGRITLKNKDVFNVFPDPDATDVNEGGSFFIIAEAVSVEKIREEYPDKAKGIKADLIDPMGDRRYGDEKVRFKSPVSPAISIEEDVPAGEDSSDKCLKISCFIKSNEVIETTNELTGETKRSLKYPKGRLICIAGGVVLHGEDNPYDDGLFPYGRFINYIDPGQFWGISEVEQLMEPQKTKNKILSFCLDIMTLAGNPIWIVDDSAMIDTDNLTNQPNLVVEKAQGSEVRRESGLEINPTFLNLYNLVSKEFDDISGDTEASRGVQPEGAAQSGFSIDLLQQAQQTRIRQKSRNLDACMQQVGQLYLSRVFQFYTVPRIVRTTNNQNASHYFKFYVDKNTDPATGEESKTVKVRRFEQGDTGNWSESVNVMEYPVKGNFDVKVTTGSSLPFSKAERQNKALQLFDRHIVDEEEVLTALDYPNKEKVLNRLRERQAQAAQAEAMKAGGGPGGPPPPPPPPGGAPA